MNHHLRFANRSVRPRGVIFAALALAVCALLTGCQHSGDRLLSVSESVPPRLARDMPYIHVQCYFFTAPDDFELLKSTQGAHVAGIYSPQDGEKLVSSLKRRRGFELAASPSVTMRQGKEGKVDVHQEFIYPTQYKPTEVAKDESGAFSFKVNVPTEFETTNLGFTAVFTGRKQTGGVIALDINVQRRAFLGFVNYGEPIKSPARGVFGRTTEVTLTENSIMMPIFDDKRLATSVTLADGHYVALGGLRPVPHPQLDRHVQGGFVNPFGDEKQNLFALVKATAVGAEGR